MSEDEKPGSTGAAGSGWAPLIKHWATFLGVLGVLVALSQWQVRWVNVYFAQAYSGHGLNATHLAGKLLAEAIAGQQGGGFDLFARVPHLTFPGGRHLRSPLLALGMLWYRLKELL